MSSSTFDLFPILVGPPPADPRTISFDRSCFRTVGTITEFVIVFSAPKYPEVYTDRAKAEERARQVGRPLEERTRPVVRRVSWTLGGDK